MGFLNFRRILGNFGIFGEFSARKDKKSLVLRISRYSIWEVRYDILFDIQKSPIYQHSINSRYNKLTLAWDLYLDSVMTSQTLPVQASHLPRLVMLHGSFVHANFDDVLLLIEKQLPAWWW